MKLRVYSDLHLRPGGTFDIPRLNGDSDSILVLAGDISEGIVHTEKVISWCDRFKKVIYVPGNHEYYFNTIDSIDDHWNDYDRLIDNFHYLQKKTLIVDNFRFIGCTLWSDLELEDNPSRVYELCNMINDYRLIRGKFNKSILPTITDAIHKDHLQYLKNEINSKFDGKTIVVTHHVPSYTLLQEKFKNSPLNCCFNNNLDHLMGDKIDLWIYGHNHFSSDTNINGTRVLSNQRGYSNEFDKIGFDINHLIEI